jgi:hypothetical protein
MKLQNDNVPAAWRQVAAHCRLCGARNLQVRTAFWAGYTATCAKPLVVCSLFFKHFCLSFQFPNLSHI